MTASSRINSHTDLNRIDETHGIIIIVEEGDLLVSEKNIDRQTYAHHNTALIKSDESTIGGFESQHEPCLLTFYTSMHFFKHQNQLHLINILSHKGNINLGCYRLVCLAQDGNTPVTKNLHYIFCLIIYFLCCYDNFY